MSFFMSADYSLSTKVMEIIYFIIRPAVHLLRCEEPEG